MTAKLEDYFIFGPITVIRYISTTISMFPRANIPKVSTCRSPHDIVFLCQKHKHIDRQKVWSMPVLPAILGTEGRVSLHRNVSSLCVASTERKPACTSVWSLSCGWYMILAMMSEQETLDCFFVNIVA